MTITDILAASQIALPGFLWSLALFASMHGIGWAGQKCLRTQLPTWSNPITGAGLFILLTGWLDYLQLAKLPVLTLIALAGIAACIPQLLSLQKTGFTWGWKETIITGAAALLALLASYAPENLPIWDDSVGYYPTCNELMVSGTSWAPMSLRRALTFGGQFPLQALGMLFTQDRGGWIYEAGLGTWIMLGIALDAIKNKKGVILIPLAIGLLLLLQTNTNSAPNHLVGLLLFAAWAARKNPILLAILSTATLALRTQTLPFIGILIAYELLQQSQAIGIKPALKNACIMAGIGLLCLIPYLLNSIHQFGTPCPLFAHGTIDPAYINMTAGWKTSLFSLTKMFGTQIAPVAFLLFALKNKETRGIATAALATIAAITLSTNDLGIDYWTKYSWPYLIAGILPTLTGWAKDNQPTLAIFGICACLAWPLGRLESNLERALTEIVCIDLKKGENYQAQDAIPEGATVAVISRMQTSNFDFRRNKIVNLDVFPAVGNLPQKPDPTLWKEWAEKNNIQFLLHPDFTGTLQGQNIGNLFLDNPNMREPHYQKVWVPKRKNLLETLTALDSILPHKKTGDFYILDLQ